jgi:hypothetical protein
MKSPLDQLEARLKSLIEGSVARIFPIAKNQEDLASHLIEAMKANIHPQEDGGYWAPNIFILSIHPAQARILQEEHALLEELADLIYQEGTEAGLQFPSHPVISVSPESELALNETRILAHFNMDQQTSTSILESPAEPVERAYPAGAYLIVNGTQIFQLSGGVVNIGRSTQNDIVLQDLRVSRTHAQLRAISRRYVIFDLNSTGGSFVNGERIDQTALYPGDVISLAGVPIVYGQDPSSASGETQRMPPFDEPR